MFNFINLNLEEQKYLEYHKKRFDYLVKQVDELVNTFDKSRKVKILDIGPHFQTTLLKQHFGDKVIINTLGWENTEKVVPKGVVNKHYHFDLNDTAYKSKWIECEAHDIIVMAEVFEHLYTAPEYFLAFLNTALETNGYLLIGTPNAVSLSKRIGLLKGINPFEKIRVALDNPGHFREYTVEELMAYGTENGFNIYSYELSDFYPQGYKAKLLKKYFNNLSDCIHIIYSKK